MKYADLIELEIHRGLKQNESPENLTRRVLEVLGIDQSATAKPLLLSAPTKRRVKKK